MSAPVIDPPEDAESIRKLLHEVRWRLGICVLAFLAGLLLASVPMFTGLFGLESLASATIIYMGQMATAFDGPRANFGDVVRLRLFVSALWALALVQPILIYQGLALRNLSIGLRHRAGEITDAPRQRRSVNQWWVSAG